MNKKGGIDTMSSMYKTLHVSLTLPKNLVEKIDSERGLISRSKYIAHTLMIINERRDHE